MPETRERSTTVPISEKLPVVAPLGNDVPGGAYPVALAENSMPSVVPVPEKRATEVIS